MDVSESADEEGQMIIVGSIAILSNLFFSLFTLY